MDKLLIHYTPKRGYNQDLDQDFDCHHQLLFWIVFIGTNI